MKGKHVADDDSPLSRVASTTGGAIPIDIEGPMRDVKFRLEFGMTDADRALRKQWLKDQIVAENEPVHVPGLYEAKYNPIRRAFRYPFESLQRKMTPLVGGHTANRMKSNAKLFVFASALLYPLVYYCMYNKTSWEEGHTGVIQYKGRKILMPGQPGYSEDQSKPKNYYADFGFSKADPRITGIRAAE